jgi:pyruvate, water dikinase
MVVMLWGVTKERLQAWAGSQDGDARQLPGYAASPGEVEGEARVVRSADQLDEVQPGEVLVCTITSPAWAPIFSKIAATVTDIGGIMSHAAIVSREYGLPAVVGTGTATSRIKTGQRIKVDGSTGMVEILD